MLVQIEGDNVAHALEEAIIKFPIFAREEQSRNGPVLTMPGPTYITIHRPWERVLFDPVRNANPFFHLAEFVWMMSGSNDVRFIERFNKRMREYADAGTDVHHGAYGHRWRQHFGVPQLQRVAELLRTDPTTRRAVLGMWDPTVDLGDHADLPCNTHIYFRAHQHRLDMTVCNRSNDLLWGCLGANAVHMTYLHELMAHGAGLDQGVYQVFTNNLHVYKERPDWGVMQKATPLRDDYGRYPYTRTQKLLGREEKIEDFLSDAEHYVAGDETYAPRTAWFRGVFLPAMKNFQARKMVEQITAQDWNVACSEWLGRKYSNAILKG